MIKWPTGTRESDGIWGKYWYENVYNSTGFQKKIINNFKIPKKYNHIYKACLKYYQQLLQFKI